MNECTRLDDESTAMPSPTEDAALIAELDQLEVRGIARPVVPRAIRRDDNRWNLHPPPGVEPDPIVLPARPATRGAWLPVVVGLCAGAAASAAVFHDQVAGIVAFLVR